MSNPSMPIGGVCFLLGLAVAPGRWKDAGEYEWLLDNTPDDARAVGELGRATLHGVSCAVFLCSDHRVRAVPMIENGKDQK